MKNTIALENIRSAYNVWNIIRTADALGFNVILLWYSPWKENEKLLKTSLWAEKNVNLQKFYNVKEWLDYIKKNFKTCIAWEITDEAVSIYNIKKYIKEPTCILLWNEVKGISLEALEYADIISFIPMEWIKESLNVCEAASIFMYEIKRNILNN